MYEFIVNIKLILVYLCECVGTVTVYYFILCLVVCESWSFPITKGSVQIENICVQSIEENILA
jgi:hypothetical protein